MRLDESDLARLIGAAFDRLPEPAAARLEGLERRLLERPSRTSSTKRPRASFWWLLAGLVATGAAAWWGGEYLSGSQSQRAPPLSAPSVTETPERQDQQGFARERGDEQSENVLPKSETRSQTIYQREVF